MNAQQFVANGLVDLLAKLFQSEMNVQILLVAIGYPIEAIPRYPEDVSSRLRFWLEVAQAIEDGAGSTVISRDLQVLVDAAWRIYPRNADLLKFAGYQRSVELSDSESEGTGATYRGLSIEGCDDIPSLLASARRHATGLGIDPNSVNVRYHSAAGVLLSLANWNDEQVVGLANYISAAISRTETSKEVHRIGAARITSPGIAVTIASPDSTEDYLLNRLLVEGPDQQQFEVTDVPASTLVRDIAEGVFAGGYDDHAPAQKGKAVGGVELRVERRNENGTNERLSPDLTLREIGVRDGDVLFIFPNTAAGGAGQTKKKVFLSYSSADKYLATQLALRLTASGISVWWDEKEIDGTRAHFEQIGDAMDAASCAIVCVGPNGIGPFQKLEIGLALDLNVGKQLPLVPVLLTRDCRTYDIPGLLRPFSYVHLSDGVRDRHGMKSLLDRIQRYLTNED